MRTLWVAMALAIAMLSGAPALAQVVVPREAFTREDAQIFRPTTDAGDYFTTYDSGTLPQGHFSLGLWADYALDPLEVRELESDTTLTELVTNLGTAQFTGAVGVFPNFHIGTRVPLYLVDLEDVFAGNQRVVNGGTEFGIGDVVVNGKVTLVDRDVAGVGLALVPELTIPTGDKDQFMGTGELGYGGLLALDFRPVPQLALGANVGGVIREDVGSDRGDFEDQIRLNVAAAYDFTERFTGIGEVFHATDAERPWDREVASPVELRGGMRVHLGVVDLTAGAGVGLNIGRGAPKFRVFAGATPPRPKAPEKIEGADADLSSSRKTFALRDRDEDNRPSPGDHIEYQIHVVNIGTEPAINVLVEDRIPEYTRYVPGSLAIEGTVMTDQAGDDPAEIVPGPPATAIFRLARLDNTPGQNEVTVSFVAEVDSGIRSVVSVVNRPSVISQGRPRYDIPPVEVQVFPSLREREHVIIGRDKLELTNNIHFEFDKAVIQPESYPILEELAQVLRDYPDLRIRIEGHTDSVGTEAYNQKLSDRRALAVRDFLIGVGIDESRFEWVGRGELQPIATNDTATGRAMNRRMEFWVLNPEALEGLELREKTYEQDLAPASEPDWLQDSGAPVD